MEATGLAVGVVGLRLQLATTLQIYVEGVAGVEDRLQELSFDVASTVSALKQLQDVLDEDKAVVETPSSDQDFTGITIFTDQGRRDIHSLSRRCEKVYQGIVRVIVDASAPPSAKGKAIARNVGLSDLTATRLAQFGRDLKWPWVEPRVKACQEQLRWLKMDLLVHLQVATVARIHLQRSPKQVANSDDESVLEDVAERLIAQRARYRKAALEGRRQRKIPANMASQRTASFENEDQGLGTSQRGVQGTQLSTPGTDLVHENSHHVSSRGPWRLAKDVMKELSRSPVSDDAMKVRIRGRASVRSTQSPNPIDEEDSSQDLNPTLLRGNNRPFSRDRRRVGILRGYHTEAVESEDDADDPFDIEAWTLPSPGIESQRLPFKREAIMRRIQLATENGDASAWDQFLALAPEQRDQVQHLIAQSGKSDARPRSYLALETREGETIVFVAASQFEELVDLADPIGRTWQFPYKDFNSWSVAKEHICLLEAQDASIRRKITKGQFDILAESGAYIPPMLWHQFVRPGRTLKMIMWEQYDPAASYSSRSSRYFFNKLALKRLFTFRRRRAPLMQPRQPRQPGGAYTPGTGLQVAACGINPPRLADTVSAISSPSDEVPSEFDLTPVGPDNTKLQKLETTNVELVDGDLFEFSDEEEELDTTESFRQLLVRLTNAKKGQASFI